jgi:peroxiredoxin
LCNSELRGIEQNIEQFNAQGIRPVAISVDTPEESRNLVQEAKYTFPFLSDQNAEAIRRYDLVHAGAGENGRDIARPAEFLIDSTGTVRWVHLTENYWMRARAEDVLEVSKQLK